MLDALDAALTGRGPADPEAEPLKAALAERGLPPRHALDLLDAFRMDATQAALRRLARAHALLQPLGDAGRPLRARCAWRGAADDLAGLRRDLRGAAGDQPSAGLRQGLPQSRPRLPAARRRSRAHGARVEDLGAPQASAGPEGDDRRARGALARASSATARALADLVADTRLAMEIAAIRRLAVALATGLKHRDPLSREGASRQGRASAMIALGAAAGALLRRPFVRRGFVGARRPGRGGR